MWLRPALLLLALLLICSGLRYESNGRFNFTVYEQKDMELLPSRAGSSSLGFFDSKEVYRWKNRDEYYHTDLKAKLADIMLAHEGGGCYSRLKIDEDRSIPAPTSSSSSYISASAFPPSAADVAYWRGIARPKQMRVEPYLCSNVYSKKNPIFNNTGCQLPTYMHIGSPRCQTKYLLWICESSQMGVDEVTRADRFVVPEADHGRAEAPPMPFLITARDSFVSMCGQVASPCGPLMTTTNCMAAELKSAGMAFSRKTKGVSARGMKQLQRAQLPAGTPYDSSFVHVGRLFVAAQTDDTYVYHTHLEIFSRVLMFAPFLAANPDVHLLWGCDSKKDKRRTEAGLRHGFAFLEPLLALVGINSSRVITHQNVHADHVYLPSDGACQDPVYNTWQLLGMRDFFYRSLGIQRDATSTSSKPLLLLLKRSSNARATRNGHDSVRQWSDSFAVRVAESIQQSRVGPHFDVRIVSDRDERTMRCHSCQVRMFSQARVLVGVHGAGLANMLYMPSSSAVMELCPYTNDGRCLLGGGPFSRLAAVLSHNYAIHHPAYAEFKWMSDLSSEFNVTRFTQHVSSFLASIDFIPKE